MVPEPNETHTPLNLRSRKLAFGLHHFALSSNFDVIGPFVGLTVDISGPYLYPGSLAIHASRCGFAQAQQRPAWDITHLVTLQALPCNCLLRQILPMERLNANSSTVILIRRPNIFHNLRF